MKQNNNIFEELGRMKNLISTKRGVVISEQVNDINTDIQTIKGELDKGFANSDEQKIVDVLKKYTSDKSTFQNFLNQYKVVTGTIMTSVLPSAFQRGRDDKEVEDLNSSLLKLGVKLELIFDNKTRKVNAVFTGLDDSASSGTANTDELWKNPKVSCVTTQPGVKPGKLKDDSTAYFLNGVTYYNNGRKRLSDGTMGNYSCSTEFKKPNAQQQQQYLKNVTNYSNEIQTSLGITPTGKLSNTDLDKIIASL